jgi:hypothetical protein
MGRNDVCELSQVSLTQTVVLDGQLLQVLIHREDVNQTVDGVGRELVPRKVEEH